MGPFTSESHSPRRLGWSLPGCWWLAELEPRLSICEFGAIRNETSNSFFAGDFKAEGETNALLVAVDQGVELIATLDGHSLRRFAPFDLSGRILSARLSLLSASRR